MPDEREAADIAPLAEVERKFSIGVDTGGTCTDVALVDRESGRFWTAKTLSTPGDPSRAFSEGIRQVLARAAVAPGAVSHVFHGTTVATNAILEGAGARTALLTTRGFKHVVEIGRQDVPRAENIYAYVKPRRPVPASRIFEIGGRIDADGSEYEALVDADIERAAARMRALGVEAVAVCYLHSFMNATHERRTAALLARLLPGVMVTLSSDVLPVFREYERSMTTLLNAYVMPLVSTYVGRLQARLTEASIDARLLLMKSNGGVAGAEAIRRSPVHTALSGPAAGAMGVRLIGKLAGCANVIGVDIGGTSADICLIQGGEPSIETQGQVGNWPLQFPMISITTIGAGGGSIARVTSDGLLRVGPMSAGAEPGPACYSRGGTEPTVTDAHVVLGHLPGSLLDGAMVLDPDKAIRAIESIAKPLGLSLTAAAEGVLSVADNTMVGAMRVVSVQRGLDPKNFVLVPFGGAGPLHGASLARLLGIPKIVIPPDPGVLSGLGLLVTRLRSDYSRVCLQRTTHCDLPLLASSFAELEAGARAWFEEERIPEGGRELHWWAELRYLRQGSELRIPWPGRAITPDAVQELAARFHATHENLFTFQQPDTPIEIVTLMVEAAGALPQPKLGQSASSGKASDAVIGRQQAIFDGVAFDCPMLDRRRMRPGTQLTGPAIITQLDCTTIMIPGQMGRVDGYGNLIITGG
ncbi:MAG: hydantoinase/oxoprolinase family protein [Betaproteobacteria bacterium]|nr:hydantoinase/oxoprolinase family protein [Betaproteobacteria bacterium]